MPSEFSKVAAALPDLKKLQTAASALEGDLFKQLLKAASPKGGLLGGGSGSKIYEDMYQQAVSDQAAKSGNLGVAKAIFEKMAPTVIAQAADNQAHKSAGNNAGDTPVTGGKKS